MQNKLYRIVLALFLIMGNASMLYAEKYYKVLPMYYEFYGEAEWVSELLEFKEPIEGIRLTVFKSNNDSHKYNGFPQVVLAEVDITDANGREIGYIATTNSLARNEGNGLAGLSDNDTGNKGYYHSAYSGNADISPSDYVYIEFKFHEPQKVFMYKMTSRDNGLDFPSHFTFSKLGEKGRIPYNPTNPSEPDNGFIEHIVYHKVNISAQPASVASVTSGGEFTSGTRKGINTSPKNTNYKFSHWTLNDEYYTEKASFDYIVEEFDANFVAHYKFDPTSPLEPEVLPEIITYPLYLTCNIENVCTFNQANGNEYEANAWVDLQVTLSKGYEFKGWYRGDVLINTNTRFNYQMPDEEVRLTARVEKIKFDPTDPNEPKGDQDNVEIGYFYIIYMVDGVEYKRERMKYGATISPEPTPTKEGHTFNGWSNVPTTMPDKNITITGYFTRNKYRVTFKIDNEVITTDSLEYGVVIMVPEVPEREGHTFSGWGDVEETVPAHDVSYNGSYIRNTYKVYYYVGEELVHTVEVTYGEEIPEYTYEQEDGYSFSGWIGEFYQTMPAHDVIYRANVLSGIESSTIHKQSAVKYDLVGRKIENTQKLKYGIYIVNRKKIMIK